MDRAELDLLYNKLSLGSARAALVGWEALGMEQVRDYIVALLMFGKKVTARYRVWL